MRLVDADTLVRRFQVIRNLRPLAEGPSGPFRLTWKPTMDPKEIAARIEFVSTDSFVHQRDDGQALIAFGASLQARLANGEVIE